MRTAVTAAVFIITTGGIASDALRGQDEFHSPRRRRFWFRKVGSYASGSWYFVIAFGYIGLYDDVVGAEMPAAPFAELGGVLTMTGLRGAVE
ncbi:MAG TPA: hypothetical protein VM620_07315 [Hyphomicrobium sp.]|jgi:hypothetical protein|nr:hypothetical protein [Hyphomicrobium sp.]